MSRASPFVWSLHHQVIFLFGIKAFRTAGALSAGDVGASQYWTLLPLTLGHTMITPAVDALHLPYHRYPGMPVVTVLVIVLAKFAVSRAICLHHVAVLQACRGPLLIRTLLTAVRGIPSYRMTAGQHRTCHLLTVYLAC